MSVDLGQFNVLHYYRLFQTGLQENYNRSMPRLRSLPNKVMNITSSAIHYLI